MPDEAVGSFAGFAECPDAADERGERKDNGGRAHHRIVEHGHDRVPGCPTASPAIPPSSVPKMLKASAKAGRLGRSIWPTSLESRLPAPRIEAGWPGRSFRGSVHESVAEGGACCGPVPARRTQKPARTARSGASCRPDTGRTDPNQYQKPTCARAYCRRLDWRWLPRLQMGSWASAGCAPLCHCRCAVRSPRGVSPTGLSWLASR